MKREEHIGVATNHEMLKAANLRERAEITSNTHLVAAAGTKSQTHM
jgi:hypothetical protein